MCVFKKCRYIYINMMEQKITNMFYNFWVHPIKGFKNKSTSEKTIILELRHQFNSEQEVENTLFISSAIQCKEI